MTYEKLLEIINRMPPERLKDDVSVYLTDSDEYYPVYAVLVSDDTNDVLDPGHYFIAV